MLPRREGIIDTGRLHPPCLVSARATLRSHADVRASACLDTTSVAEEMWITVRTSLFDLVPGGTAVAMRSVDLPGRGAN